MKYFFCFFNILATLGASQAYAVDYTLPVLIQKAFEDSRTLKASAKNLEKAQAQTEKAKSAIFPTINATASAGSKKASTTSSSAASSAAAAGSAVDVYTVGIDVAQPLYVGGAVTSGLALAHTNEDIADQALLSEKQKLVITVVGAYYDLIEKKLKIQEAQSNIDVLHSYLEITRRYERIGRARNTDRLLAEMSYSDSLIELQTYSDELRSSEYNLKKLIGTPVDQSLSVEISLNAPLISKLDSQQAVDSAFQNNPEIKSASFAVEAVGYSKTIDLSQDLPTVTLNGTYGYQSPDRPSLFDSTSNNYSMMLNVKVPLFSGLSSFAKRADYESQRSSAEFKLNDLKRNIETQVRNLIENIETQKNILKMQETNLKESAKALDIILKSYQNGTASSNDVVSMQRTRYEAGKRYISSQVGYLKSVLNLRQLLGTDLYKIYGQ